jgi:PST family polysaccharide transporter
MRKIVKITSILGVATLVKMVAGVARAKFLAWQIGPVGVGVVSQALAYSSFAIQLCSLNICFGIVKSVSEGAAQKDDGAVSRIVDTSLTLELAASLVFMVLILPFSSQLSRFVFSDPKYWIYFVGITMITPFALFLVGIADPVFYGLKKIAAYTRLMIYYTLFGLFIVFPLVYFLKTEGMLIQIIVAAGGGFLISLYFIRKEFSLKPRIDLKMFKDGASRSMMGGLFKYGATSFITANVGMFVMLYLRSLLIKQYGAAANGHYQVAFAISAYYLPFITNAIWGYFYPEMCALKNNDDINRELNQFVRFALFVSTAVAALCIIFREYIILILYSREFMPAYEILPIQAVGDIFFILFYIFNTSLLARKRFKSVLLVSTFGYNISLIVLYLIFTRLTAVGFQGLNIAIALANLGFAAALMIYHKVDTGFSLTRSNVELFFKNVIFIAIILFTPGRSIAVIGLKIILSVAWLFIAITRQELKSSIDLVMSSFKKRGVDA